VFSCVVLKQTGKVQAGQSPVSATDSKFEPIDLADSYNKVPYY